MVSVEPIITEATLPGKLSGPKDLKIESTRAKEPLPEIGRNSMRGIVSFGTAIKFPMGASKEVIMSSAPEAFNMETATINPISEGAIEKVEKKPSFAPEMNVSNKGIFLKMPNIIINPTAQGIT